MSLVERFLKWALPHKDIVKDGSLYLRRHYLTPRTWRWRLFLHLIARPDADREPHQHPWPWVGVILSGSYMEAVFDKGQFREIRIRKPWHIGKRPSDFTHKIVKLFKGRSWTLVLAGRTERIWGFYLADDTFVPSTEYFGAGNEVFPEDVFRK